MRVDCRHSLHGLYALTDPGLQRPQDLLRRVEAVLSGGARLLQYRDKSASPRRWQEARRLATLCHTRGAVFIINDDVELAAAVAADGVHLGRDDLSLREARARLGTRAIIGISCYNELARAQVAAAGGADYVAFGRIYPSATKPGAVHAPLELLRVARGALDLPIVAIGGITPENARQVIATGVDAVAVVNGVFGVPNPALAARRIAQLFDD
ncbi:MAG: thiamine phosphate synthase [Nitrococcus sp.]|nr:thiamine phosphate synthase [Nitrococcus sp.]